MQILSLQFSTHYPIGDLFMEVENNFKIFIALLKNLYNIELRINAS